MTPKIVERLTKKARRILAGDVYGAPGKRIYPGYFSFELPARPAWWSDALLSPEWGNPLGVHTVEPSVRRAFVVTELGLAVFNDPSAPVWVAYEAIAGWNKLEKDETVRSLTLKLHPSGNAVELHFSCVGEAFAFVQFVGYATERLAIEGTRVDDAAQS